MRAVLAVAAALVVGAAGCSREEPANPLAERGRQVYVAQCIACHHPDPALPGALGPPVKPSSLELLEAKLVRGTYPPGYTPRRPTTVMPVQPGVAAEVPALAEFLK
ncbi:MAG: c-type cytochrome [Candidatus Rokuibacteriota bacterium]